MLHNFHSTDVNRQVVFPVSQMQSYILFLKAFIFVKAKQQLDAFQTELKPKWFKLISTVVLWDETKP